MSATSRRELIRLSAVALAAQALPARWAWGSEQLRHVRVLVVGGGLAGLTAARELVRLGVDSVVLLEARDRVGGRTLNLPLPGGHVVEGGGEWIGPGQDRIAALAQQLGVETFGAYYDGASTYEIMGHVSRGLLPDLEIPQGINFMRLAWRLDAMADELPHGTPWTSPRASEFDGITLAQWLRAEGATDWTLECFRIITRAIMSGYPERISLLWFLFYLKSGGGLLPIALNDNGLQDLRFVGGSQLVSLRAAQQLGARVQLGEPVISMTDSTDGPVEVRTTKARYLADRVVVAMAPPDTLRIDFLTGMSPQRRELVQRWARLPRLPLIKHSVIYDRPFWRAKGLNGNVVTDRAPMQLIFDNSPQDGSLGVLTCFLSAAEVPAMASESERARLAPLELARYFGTEALTTAGYVEKDWSTDPWNVSCITPLTPGILTAAGPALRERVGHIHWAGTESAEQGAGYMDGAVRSGERVADEVRRALG